MAKIVGGLPKFSDPNLLVGGENMDDAGIYKIDDEKALVQTLDFFTPMVDEPYIFGQIAAVNSLNDIYAMGGKPLTAMNIVCFPNCLDMEVLKEILLGGAHKIEEAGAVLVGGHSVEDDEPKYGLSVTGIVNPQSFLTNGGVKPGQSIILTKPIGTGIINTAIKGKIADDTLVVRAVELMTSLNNKASEVMLELGATGCTDVTGFGLLGHLAEMAEASNVTIEIELSLIPIMQGVYDLAAMGIVPAGARNNLSYLENKVSWNGKVNDIYKDILADPQTAGGLLISIDSSRAYELVTEMQSKGNEAYIIGRALEYSGKYIKVEG